MSINLNEHDPDVLFGDQLLAFESKLNQLSRRNNIDSTLLALNTLYTQVSTYLNNLEQAYNKFRSEDNELRIQIVEKEALAELRGLCDDILYAEMQIALEINTEFNNPVFTERLTQAVYDPRTIRLNVINGVLNVIIDLDTTAGKLSDWADAVKGARKRIPHDTVPKQLRGIKASPELRSKMWKEKFYGPAREGIPYGRTNKRTGVYRDLTAVQTEKYWTTIANRLEMSASIAPFWHILNFGIAGYNTKTGGTAYPQNTRTNFVGKAIGRMKAKYQSLYQKAFQQYSQEFAQLEKKYRIRMQQAQRVLDRIIAKMDQLAAQQSNVIAPTPFAEEMNYLKQHLGEERFLMADRKKLIDLAERLSKGEEIASRVSLGGGVRTRTKRIIQKFRGY